MHKAVCSKCGKDCEVPFRPTGEKPVLCRDCYRESGGQQTGRTEERNFQRPSFQQDRPVQNNEYKAQLDALSRKVDKILEILTAATSAHITSEEIAQPEPIVEKTSEIVETTPVEQAPAKKKSTKKAL